MSATHILFDTKKRTSDEARKLAADARAKIAAGADMQKLAREISDDPTAGQNGGALGFFVEKDMDPAFAKAAFALAKPGDLSEPVQSQFGWHVIRLDDKRAPTVEELRGGSGDHHGRASEAVRGRKARDAAIGAIRRDPKTQVNQDAVNALTPKVDPEVMRRAREAVLQGAPAAPPK